MVANTESSRGMLHRGLSRALTAILEGDLLCNETLLLEAAAKCSHDRRHNHDELELTTRCRVYFGLCPGGFSLVGGTIPLSRK